MLILDFYVDEPSCLGVSPYVSPYVRYIAGALVSGGYPAEKISYMTADQWRENGKVLGEDYPAVFVISGSTVPGKYLGARIGTTAELLELLQYTGRYHKGTAVAAGGPVRHAPPEIRQALREAGGFLITGDTEIYAAAVAAEYKKGVSPLHFFTETSLKDPLFQSRRSYDETDSWSAAGAFITTLHPRAGWLMMEIESYRGCPRTVHCSFCTEALYGPTEYRSVKGITAEISELYKMGNRHFRLGRQADLAAYRDPLTDGAMQNIKIIKGFPAPHPPSLAALYQGIREAAPDLKTLHMDNLNPGTLSNHPAEGREAVRIIASLNTPGDTAAMGMESADPAVVKANHLKASPEEILTAVRIVNEEGGRRANGIAHLLPGLNFIQGLAGETDSTFKKNYQFLEQLKKEGLLLRRINIRRAVTHQDTPLAGLSAARKQNQRTEERFTYFKEKIREDIDRYMLSAVYPPGTVLRDLITEAEYGVWIFARQMGSYPVTVRLPVSDRKASVSWKQYSENSKILPLNAVVLGAEDRSLTALTLPLRINDYEETILTRIPGIGKKRATKIILNRPIKNYQELADLLEDKPFGKEEFYAFD